MLEKSLTLATFQRESESSVSMPEQPLNMLDMLVPAPVSHNNMGSRSSSPSAWQPSNMPLKFCVVLVFQLMLRNVCSFSLPANILDMFVDCDTSMPLPLNVSSSS